MKLFILLCVLNAVLAKDDKPKEEKKIEVSKDIVVNGTLHEPKVMINGINRPYQLSYSALKNRNEVLYFSYNCGHQNESSFEVGFAINGTTIPNPIPEVKNGFATAIDTEHGCIFFGGSDGIYQKFLGNLKNKVIKIENNFNIWDLFYKDDLYFITFPKGRLYKLVTDFKSELQQHIHEKIYQFAIDGHNDTFITNKTGLFMIKNGTHHRIHIKGASIFRAIAVNKKGVVHLCGRNEIYVVDKKKHVLHKIAKIKNIFGLTFDIDDNIIYSDPHQIVKLLPKEPQNLKETISHVTKDQVKEVNKILISGAGGQPVTTNLDKKP